MPNIPITTSSFAQFDDEPLAVLKAAGHEPVLNPHGRNLTPAETIDLLQGCPGVVAGTEKYTREVLEALPDLKVISRVGVGVDSIDLAAAKDLGVTVVNTPDGPTLSVAEYTLGHILGLLRHVTTMHNELSAGTWKKRMGNLLSDKKVGIIGFGRIGQKVAELLAPFNVEIAYFDVADLDTPDAWQAKSLEELLGWADVISLHVSKGGDKPLVGADEMALIKDGSWIVNMARGGVVCEEALEAALKSGKLAGAVTDVFAEEPYTGPLQNCPNLILSPHAGSYAKEGRITMETNAVKNLLAALA